MAKFKRRRGGGSEHKHGKHRAFRIKKGLRAPLEQMGLRKVSFQKPAKPQNGFNSAITSAGKPGDGAQSEDGFSPPPVRGSLFHPKLLLHIVEWKRPQPVNPGLRNLGNTCFLNSVLQCLTYTPALAQFMQQRELARILRDSGSFSVAKSLEKHIATCSKGSSKGALAPMRIVRNIKFIGRQFKLGRQEDAHEFTRCLIDLLHRTALKAAGVKESSPLATTSFVHRIFGGFLRSQIRCLRCGRESNTFDPFLDVPLELSGKTTSVDRAFKLFTRPEKLEGDNGWNCDRCKRKVDARKQLSMRSLPNVMTLLLKRFRFGGLLGGKISVPVAYPKVFDASPYTCSEELKGPAARYHLYGVLVHAGGSMQFGHYYCYVKASNGIWYNMDDANVRQVSEATALQQQAYMLFYARDRKGAAAALATETPEAMEAPAKPAPEAEAASAGPGKQETAPLRAAPSPPPATKENARGLPADPAAHVKAPAAPTTPTPAPAPGSKAAAPISEWSSLTGPGASVTEGEEAEEARAAAQIFPEAGGETAKGSPSFDEATAAARAAKELAEATQTHEQQRAAYAEALRAKGLSKKERRAAMLDAPTNPRELAGVACFASHWAHTDAPSGAQRTAVEAGAGCSDRGSGSGEPAGARNVGAGAVVPRDLQPMVAAADTSDEEEEEGEEEEGDGDLDRSSRAQVSLSPSAESAAGGDHASTAAGSEEDFVQGSRAACPSTATGSRPPTQGWARKLRQLSAGRIRQLRDGFRKRFARYSSGATAEDSGPGGGSSSGQAPSTSSSSSEESESTPAGEARPLPGEETPSKRRRVVAGGQAGWKAVSWRSTMPGASLATSAWEADAVAEEERERHDTILKHHIRKEREERKGRKLDSWDRALDQGRVKKVKGAAARRIHEVHGVESMRNSFQRTHERQKKRGAQNGRGKKRNRPPPSVADRV